MALNAGTDFDVNLADDQAHAETTLAAFMRAMPRAKGEGLLERMSCRP